jgi:hypothetical protein
MLDCDLRSPQLDRKGEPLQLKRYTKKATFRKGHKDSIIGHSTKF